MENQFYFLYFFFPNSPCTQCTSIAGSLVNLLTENHQLFVIAKNRDKSCSAPVNAKTYSHLKYDRLKHSVC